jgi:hypothetical protein
MGRSLIRLFIQPDSHNLARSLSAVDHAIICVQNTNEPFAPHFDTSALRRVKSYLHFIRTCLLDPQSPLAGDVTQQVVEATPQGQTHAT